MELAFTAAPTGSGNNKLSVDWRRGGGFGVCCNVNPCNSQVNCGGSTFGWLYVDDGEGLIAGSEPGPGPCMGSIFLLMLPALPLTCFGYCCCLSHLGFHFSIVKNEVHCRVSTKSGVWSYSTYLRHVNRVSTETYTNTYTVDETNDQGVVIGTHESTVIQTWFVITHDGGAYVSQRFDGQQVVADMERIAHEANTLINKAISRG